VPKAIETHVSERQRNKQRLSNTSSRVFSLSEYFQTIKEFLGFSYCSKLFVLLLVLFC